ncbi:FixH family protein [Lentibacillus sediminis]|uniref:FixH family protein n=1 Tax=Lentibacillus sediminis TaxID=1940529 RepID=UPI000C1C6756|nr:FixH family protein [Lentibacillus sediminis]
MRKQLLGLLIIIAVLLAACGEQQENTGTEAEELKQLLVDFSVPETADSDETVELSAAVTYGEEPVTDADEVMFEIWETGNEDNSVEIEGTMSEDGIYTAETTFDEEGVYEMYAHVTAKDLHTMPLKSITVGDADPSDNDSADTEAENEATHDHGNTEGFSMHMDLPADVVSGEETDLTVHVQMDGAPLEDANVRYEIWQKEGAGNHDWVDADETTAGEYHALHTFSEAGTYQVQVHVENDDGLHEHEIHEVAVGE